MSSEIREEAPPPRRRKVLIVEDNELNMKLFNDLLTPWLSHLANQGWLRGVALCPPASSGFDPDGYPASGGLGTRGDAVAKGRRGSPANPGNCGHRFRDEGRSRKNL